jgi:hypothetical protein
MDTDVHDPAFVHDRDAIRGQDRAQPMCDDQ